MAHATLWCVPAQTQYLVNRFVHCFFIGGLLVSLTSGTLLRSTSHLERNYSFDLAHTDVATSSSLQASSDYQACKDEMRLRATEIGSKIGPLKEKVPEARFCAYMDDNEINVKCKKELTDLKAKIKDREDRIARIEKVIDKYPEADDKDMDFALAEMESQLPPLQAKRMDLRLCAGMGDEPHMLKCKEDLKKTKAELAQ